MTSSMERPGFSIRSSLSPLARTLTTRFITETRVCSRLLLLNDNQAIHNSGKEVCMGYVFKNRILRKTEDGSEKTEDGSEEKPVEESKRSSRSKKDKSKTEEEKS